MLHTVDIDLDGQIITLETGKIAKQANGAVTVRSGDNVVFVSASPFLRKVGGNIIDIIFFVIIPNKQSNYSK